MNNVLITGVAGFLGSHLAEYHLAKGDYVFGIDDFSTSSQKSLHYNKLKQSHRFFFFKEDIININKEWLDIKNTNKQIDLIYNFACPASPPLYQSMPVKTLMTCFNGTKNLLDIAKVQNARIVHASTSEIYGDPAISPQHESYFGNVNSFGVRSCYDEGKRVAESLCFEYLNQDVDVRIVRIFNTYGPHMHPSDGRVVTNFIKQALENKKLTIYGDGKQSRSFCYVSDLINGITKLASIKENPKRPINIGNPVEFTMLDLAKLVLKEVHGKNDLHNFIDFKELPSDDPTQRCPDITLAKTILNWKPSVSLEEGLKYMVLYMKSPQFVKETNILGV